MQEPRSLSRTGRGAIAKAYRLALAALLAATVVPAMARAAPAADFASFWTGFRAAVVRGDRVAIADRTTPSFLLGGRLLGRRGFLASVPSLFDARTRACFRTAAPLAEGRQRMVFCDGTIFIFAPTPAGWRFTEIGVDD